MEDQTINVSNSSSDANSAQEINLDALLSTDGEPGAEGSSDNQARQIDIDERFKDLPEAEALARTMQSRYDTLYPKYQEAIQRLNELEPLTEIIDDLMNDDEALYAFLNERKPELIQSKDIGSEIKKILSEEFGSDYRPSLTREQADIEDPGGKDWQYYRRLDELYNELKNGGSRYNKIASLKAYRQKKEAMRQNAEQELKKQMDIAKQQLKMDDTEVKKVTDWAGNLKFQDLVKIYRFLIKFPTNKTASQVSQVKGTGVPTSTLRQKFIASLKS